jgi:DNA repair exonuclease SbcCD nuclease subunit
MKTTILGAGDIHFCPERAAEALASLSTLRDTAVQRKADLVVLPGDLFDRGLQATNRDAYAHLIAAIRDILEVAPIAAVAGTPSHDPPGAYYVFTQLGGAHRFTLLEPDRAYYLASGEIVTDEPAVGDPRLMLFGIPEPGKAWLLGNRNGLDRESASQAVVEAMRAILLGLGGLRRRHPELATVLLYHGSVRGATMGSGQTVGQTEVSIGAEDLEMVGADFAFLGHIHEPQMVGARAAYTGSAYPCDWAETTQRSFICAELLGPGILPVIERVDFPHAPRVKLVVDANDYPGIADDEVAGRQAWVVVRGTAEDIAQVTLDEAALIDLGALPGSRVTFEPIPVETVRAAEIADARRLRDKVGVWAEASSLVPPTECVLTKADELEDEAIQAGAVGEGLHVRVRSLTLRGAVGIWHGLGVDEITLDLDAYEPGLLALVGPNGAGKSMLIENLHPYPQMLTRSGSLPQHFRLKDSRRELCFVDERTGNEYRALILVDPTLATPKTECYLSKDGLPLCTGRVKEYEEVVGKLFGSLGLFVRSAFVAQKPPKGHPDIADATPAERKSLFRELGDAKGLLFE